MGPEDPRIADTLESNADEFEKLNRVEEAADLRARAKRLRAQKR